MNPWLEIPLDFVGIAICMLLIILMVNILYRMDHRAGGHMNSRPLIGSCSLCIQDDKEAVHE